MVLSRREAEIRTTRIPGRCIRSPRGSATREPDIFSRASNSRNRSRGPPVCRNHGCKPGKKTRRLRQHPTPRLCRAERDRAISSDLSRSSLPEECSTIPAPLPSLTRPREGGVRRHGTVRPGDPAIETNFRATNLAKKDAAQARALDVFALARHGDARGAGAAPRVPESRRAPGPRPAARSISIDQFPCERNSWKVSVIGITSSGRQTKG